jgi:hypothetical protein
MPNDKTPLVQKLILAVLTLILLCLIVLIAQNRSKPPQVIAQTDPATDVVVAPETTSEEPPTKPKITAGSAKSLAMPSAPSRISEPPPQTLSATEIPPPQLPRPESRPILVNPVRPAPVEIVVRPESSILKTELCGRVSLEGNPPPEVPISLDAACRRLRDQPLTTRHYVVGANGGLANVLVYIKEGLPPGYGSSPTDTNALLKTEACFFEPYVMGLQTGQKFTIQNRDPIVHNVHATAKNGPGFNLALASRRQTVQRSFENPEVFVRLKCDVHPWEFSYIGVVPHPFFAVTDTNGVFCLPPGLPHGRYVLAAAHPKSGETLKEVFIQDEITSPIELAFKVSR